jgi:uncharacterized delta-60 repeat protein
VTTAIPGATSFATSVVTSNNRIVVAGESVSANANVQVLVAQYRSNGTLDKTFGSNGIFTTAFPAADGPFRATAIALQPSTGKLVVAGGYGEGSILLLRLTRSGQLDPTFGPSGTGIVKLAVQGFANSIAIDGAGRILVGSADGNQQAKPFLVARFSRDGALDKTYGVNGIAKVVFWDQNQAAGTFVSALRAAPDGSVTGFSHIDYIGIGGFGSAGVFRLSPSGQLVPGFGTGGHTEVSFPRALAQNWLPCAMATDSKGRIIVAGASVASTGPVLLSARLTSSGSLDTSYGTAGNGRAVTGGLGAGVGSQTNCGGTASVTDAVTVGIGATLVRLTSAGTPDARFGPGGLIQISAPPQVDLNAVVSPGAGRIVLAGFSGNDVYVARYLTRP